MIYLHIGNGVTIPLRDIIAIYDYKLFNKWKNPLPRLEHANKEADEGKIKSVIHTDSKIYFSNISSQTLLDRSQL